MAKSKREEYEAQLEQQSARSSREMSRQGNLTKEIASKEPKTEKQERVYDSEKEAKKPGRPKQEEKTHVSIYVPDRILGGLQALYKVSGCKSMNEYITGLIERDVEENSEKIKMFNKLLNK